MENVPLAQRASPIRAHTLGARMAAAVRIALWAAGAIALELHVVVDLVR
jgi:hypothetical protein